MRAPKHQPPLRSLRSFTATYPLLGSAKEVRDFGKWVRRALAGTPNLEVLRLRREGDGGSGGVGDEDDDEYDPDGGAGIDFFGRTVHSFLTGSDEGRVRARSKEDGAEGAGESGGTEGDRGRVADEAQARSDDDRPSPSHRVAYTGLVDHVLQKHNQRIRVLDLGEALVSVRQLRQLMESCVRLEELKCVLGRQALAVFIEALHASSAVEGSVLPRLRRVSFELSNVRRTSRSAILGSLARMVLVREGDRPMHPNLRRVRLNDLIWEVCVRTLSSRDPGR